MQTDALHHPEPRIKTPDQSGRYRRPLQPASHLMLLLTSSSLTICNELQDCPVEYSCFQVIFRIILLLLSSNFRTLHAKFLRGQDVLFGTERYLTSGCGVDSQSIR